MKERKTEWFSTFKYVVPAEYEQWLEKLAAEGWNVDKIGQWSSIRMVFEKTEPKRYRYIFDINIKNDKEYKTAYEEFGWEFVGQMASCFIWRKEYSDRRPESFTDAESIEKRNKNVMRAVSFSFFIFLAIFFVLSIVMLVKSASLTPSDTAQYALGLVLTGGFSLYLGWVMKKIYLNRFE